MSSNTTTTTTPEPWKEAVRKIANSPFLVQQSEDRKAWVNVIREACEQHAANQTAALRHAAERLADALDSIAEGCVCDDWDADEIRELIRHRLAEFRNAKPQVGTTTEPASLAGLRYALSLVDGRRILNRPPAYLAALDELEIFLKAAIERVEQGQPMHSTAVVQ